MYNNNESESGINEEEGINQRGVRRNNETMKGQEQKGNTTDIENTKRENIGTRVHEESISKEQTIEEAYK